MNTVVIQAKNHTFTKKTGKENNYAKKVGTVLRRADSMA